MLDALRVKKIAYSVLGLLSAFSVALGAFCAPTTAYAMSAGAMGDINNSTYYEYDLSSLEPFCYGYDGSVYVPFEFYGKNTSFRGPNPSTYNLIFVPMPFDVYEGDIINVKGNFAYSTGTILTLRFCISDSAGVYYGWNENAITNSVSLTDWENSTYGIQFSTFGQSVVANRDSNQCYLVLMVTLEPSSLDWYLRFTNLSFSITHQALYDPDFEDVKDKQDEQTGLLDSILTGIRGLAGSIVGGLAGFLNDIRTGVNNIASSVVDGLSSFLNNIVSKLSDLIIRVSTLPTNIANALSVAFNNVVSAVNNVAQGVVDGISDFFELILGTDVLDGSYFEQFEEQWGMTSDEINDALSRAPDIFQPSGEYLPDIGEFVPSRINPFLLVMSRFFEFDFVENAFGCAIAFGTLGYIVFGKR